MKKYILNAIIGMGFGFPITLLCMALIGGYNAVVQEFLVWMVASALYGVLSTVMDTKLKKRLTTYAATYPDLCQLTEDDGNGGLRFEIDKHRVSIRLTAPYSEERKTAASQQAAKNSKLFSDSYPA